LRPVTEFTGEVICGADVIHTGHRVFKKDACNDKSSFIFVCDSQPSFRSKRTNSDLLLYLENDLDEYEPEKNLLMLVRKPTSKEIEIAAAWDTWSKEPSEFPWSYDEKETCYILEGTATVTDKNGNTISFGPGDWVEFETGLNCTWKILKTIRKRYLFG